MQGTLFTDTRAAHRFFTPERVTKQLRVIRAGGDATPKLRLSSNILPLMGFEPGQRIAVNPIPRGVEVTFDAGGKQKIYQRSYQHRRNNPTEAVMELRNQLIAAQFPPHVQRYHVDMQHGRITFKGLVERAFSARQALRALANPAQMFAAMTSGVDLHCARALGFEIAGVCEFRPQEARDKTDLTETGLMTAVANAPVRHVFNEDIYQLDWNRVADALDLPHVGVMMGSLQCDTFSSLCPKTHRDVDVSTTKDMFIPFLDGIKRLSPGVVLIEQVAGFGESYEWALLSVQLQRLGYHVEHRVLDARDYGGLTSRKRFYAVASLFPGMAWPQARARRTAPIWDQVIAPRLGECRDVTHSKAIQAGARCGRLRVINRTKPYSPTPVKSQARMAKDSLVIEEGGRYFMPSEALLKDLLSIPQDFQTAVVGKDIAAEVLGQSIEYGLHHQILAAVKDHLLLNVGPCRSTLMRSVA